MKKVSFLLCALAMILILTGVGIAKEKVVVYTSLENEEVVDYLAFAKKDLPGGKTAGKTGIVFCNDPFSSNAQRLRV